MRSYDAFDTVAWRTPTADRFDARAANDGAPAEPTLSEMVRAMPAWVMIAGGGVVAAIMGALLGGALHI